MYYTHVPSPLGKILVAGDDQGLRQMWFEEGTGARPAGEGWKRDKVALRDVIDQLRAYFDGELKAFTLDLAPVGTPFQQDVWRELQQIPHGETISYGELARRIGRPTASRAVGAANGANSLPIVIPCHRVIGSTGKLTGFGGGLWIKEALLAHESGAVRPTLFDQRPGRPENRSRSKTLPGGARR
jgi:methylated-DNA-[protein]-cysteine S-methyltransferase